MGWRAPSRSPRRCCRSLVETATTRQHRNGGGAGGLADRPAGAAVTTGLVVDLADRCRRTGGGHVGGGVVGLLPPPHATTAKLPLLATQTATEPPKFAGRGARAYSDD